MNSFDILFVLWEGILFYFIYRYYLKEENTIYQHIDSKGGKLKSASVFIDVPKNAVNSNTRFGITPLAEYKAPEGIKALSKLFEMHPHNIEFNNDVELSFQVPTNDPCVLYVQKNTLESQELDKWLVVESSVIEKQQASFLLKSFSFAFIGKPIDTKLSSSLSAASATATHDQAEPGLNFRAVCTCVPNTQGLVIIPMGYGNFSVNQVICQAHVKCPSCGTFITKTELIKQMILFQAHGEIKYKQVKSTELPNPLLQKDFYNTGDNGLCVYGKLSNTSEKYSSFNITVNPVVYNSTSKANLTYDEHGNPIGSMYDLGKNNAFSNFKVLIGKFYNLEGFTQASLEKNVVSELKAKGFTVLVTEDEAEFLRNLPNYQIAWVILCFCEFPSSNVRHFAAQLKEFHKLGNGLMFWEENNSVPTTRTNQVLKLLFGIELGGCDPGTNKMTASSNGTDSCTFKKSHPLMFGINSLYEGITIPHFLSALPYNVQVVATSSSGHPNIMCVNRTASNGPVVIDCGFTKLYSQCWDTAGTARYVKNATCWLSGIPT